MKPSAEAREQATQIVNHVGAGDKAWLRDAIAHALAEKYAAVAALRRALEKYGQHDLNCYITAPYPKSDVSDSVPAGRRGKCSCGYDAALAPSPGAVGLQKAREVRDIVRWREVYLSCC